MGDVIRTVKIKLDVPDERCDDLHQTKDQFLHCANTTAPCQCALTSGTLNLNGEFIASVDSTAEGESTDKPTTSVVGY